MNSISISGNLGKDAELRFLPDGTPVASFSVADSQGKDKPTLWWNCSLFGKRGESLSQYLYKGQKVTVIGSVSERDWTDKDGAPRKSMDVRVHEVALMGSRESSGDQSAPRTTAPRTQEAPRQAPTRSNSGGFEDMDDDIPFANPLRGSRHLVM